MTFTVPEPAGAVAVIWVVLSTVKPVAGVAPKFTAVAPVRWVPVMTQDVPPASGALGCVRPVKDGTGIGAI